jgi:O-antigen/teichoic acid export membrane protein
MSFTIMGSGIILRAITQMVLLVVSSRLFTPADIGIAAIIYAIYHLIWPWFEVALGQSYYQIGKNDIKGFESLSLLAALSCIIAIIFTAGLSIIFEKLAPGQGLRITFMTICAIAARSFSVLSSADLLKTLRIKLHTTIEQGSYIVGYSLALMLCIGFDLGVLYLILGIFLHSLFSSLLFHLYNPVRFPANYHPKTTLDMLTLSSGYFIASGLNTFVREANILLISLMISTAAAAYYSRALQVYMLGAFTIGQVFDRLLTPIIRRNIVLGIKSGQLYDLSTIILISGFIPASAFFYLNAQTIILVLFGHNWIDSAPILRILTLALTFRTCSKINEATMRAYGQAWQRVVYYILWACVLLAGAYPAASIGVAGFAWTECIGVVVFWALSSRSASRLIGKDWHIQAIALASSIPGLLIFTGSHFALKYSLRIGDLAQLGLELLIIIVLASIQIAVLTKLRYRSLNVLRQFI